MRPARVLGPALAAAALAAAPCRATEAPCSDVAARKASFRALLDSGSTGRARVEAELCAADAGLPRAAQAVYRRLSAEVRMQLGDQPGAAEELERALVLEPGDAETEYRLALALRERPEAALPHAVAAARAASARRGAAALRLSGEIRLDLGDAAGARKDFAKGLELAPEDFDLLADAARLARGGSKEAAAFGRRASAAADAAPLWCRGAAQRAASRVWLAAGDADAARERLERALDLNPDDRDALMPLAQLGGASPERRAPPEPPARVVANPAAVLRDDPDDVEALSALLEMRVQGNDFPEAVAAAFRLSEAAGAAPAWQQASAHRLAARAWLSLGETGARRDLLGAQTLDRGEVETLSLLERLSPEGPNSRGTASARAIVFLTSAHAQIEARRYADAERNLKRALALDPKSAFARQTQQRLAYERQLAAGQPGVSAPARP